MASYPLPIPPGSIVIVRHGQPALDHESSITGKEYRLWWTRYDEHGLAKGQTVPEKLKTCTHSIDTVFSSPLPRALETAQALPGDEKKEIRTESLFVEAPLPSPLWPFLRLPSRVWGGIARIVWCCGWSDGMETQAQARKTGPHRNTAPYRKGQKRRAGFADRTWLV